VSNAHLPTINIGVESLHDDFGARIRGIDLRRRLTDTEVATLHGWIDTYSLLHFSDQGLDDASQLQLTRSLGEPEPNHVVLGQTGRVEYFGTIGNVQPDGGVARSTDRRTIFQTGNNMWHSDSSFRTVPSYVSIMSAYEVPAENGETQFVSCRAAYERLNAAERAEIDPLICIHDYVYSRSKVGADMVTPSHASSLPPVRQRLVRENPANHRRNYYVGSHAKCIEGWDMARSRALLDDLLERATQPQFVHTHRWRPGDLVIWDNRCLLHRGTGYDADRYRRRMRQTRVVGAGSTLDGA
jgi:alpha-ketoglutarate-dependent 2,4-dichlorophenoxyacetate dioxygenase